MAAAGVWVTPLPIVDFRLPIFHSAKVESAIGN
jgi:hypothetical protein